MGPAHDVASGEHVGVASCRQRAIDTQAAAGHGRRSAVLGLLGATPGARASMRRARAAPGARPGALTARVGALELQTAALKPPVVGKRAERNQHPPCW